MRGRLSKVEDSGFEVEADGSSERFAYDEVLQARTVFEWGPTSEAPRGRRGKQKVGS